MKKTTRIKAIILTILTLQNITNTSHATSYPINNNLTNTKEARAPSNVSTNNYIEYPNKQIFPETELTTISTMFYYTPDLLSQLGSITNVKKFIIESVSVSNTTYENSGVPLKIKVAGIQEFYAPYNDTLDIDNGRFDNFSDKEPDKHIKNLSASHFILANRFYAEHHFTLGAAQVGGIFAYISPQFDSDKGTRTFAHETGHLLGAMHDANVNQNEALINHAYGYNCSGYASTMATGQRREIPFLSSPEILINGQPCGDERSDFAKALSNQLNKKNNYLKELPYIKPLKKPQGQLNLNTFKTIKTQNKEHLQFTVNFTNVNKNTSIQLFSNSTLLKNFNNPIIVSAQNNESFTLEYELTDDWEYQEDTNITLSVEFPLQINPTVNKITYNISSDETNQDTTENNSNTNTSQDKTSGGLSFVLALLTPLIFIRRKQTKRQP